MGNVWGPKSLFYRCFTCQVSPNSSICPDCFHNGPHEAEGHQFSVSTSVFGGSCDCGSEDSWKPFGNCLNHKRSDQEKHPTNGMNFENLIAVHLTFRHLIQLIIQQQQQQHQQIISKILDWIIQTVQSCGRSISHILSEELCFQKLEPSQLNLNQILELPFLNVYNPQNCSTSSSPNSSTPVLKLLKSTSEQVTDLILQLLCDHSFKYGFSQTYLNGGYSLLLENFNFSSLSKITTQIFAVTSISQQFTTTVPNGGFLGVLFMTLEQNISKVFNSDGGQTDKLVLTLLNDLHTLCANQQVSIHLLYNQPLLERFINIMYTLQQSHPITRKLDQHVIENNFIGILFKNDPSIQEEVLKEESIPITTTGGILFKAKPETWDQFNYYYPPYNSSRLESALGNYLENRPSTTTKKSKETLPLPPKSIYNGGFRSCHINFPDIRYQYQSIIQSDIVHYQILKVLLKAIQSEKPPSGFNEALYLLILSLISIPDDKIKGMIIPWDQLKQPTFGNKESFTLNQIYSIIQTFQLPISTTTTTNLETTSILQLLVQLYKKFLMDSAIGGVFIDRFQYLSLIFEKLVMNQEIKTEILKLCPTFNFHRLLNDGGSDTADNVDENISFSPPTTNSLLAKQKQMEILAKFSAQQSKFLETMFDSQDEDFDNDKENNLRSTASLATTTTTTASATISEHNCILCFKQEYSSQDPMCMISMGQQSSLISYLKHVNNEKNQGENRCSQVFDDIGLIPSKSKYYHSILDLTTSFHFRACGHYMHQNCHKQYLETLKKKHQRNETYEGSGKIIPHLSEFLCPLCKKLSNIIIPLIIYNTTSSSSTSTSSTSTYSISNFSKWIEYLENQSFINTNNSVKKENQYFYDNLFSIGKSMTFLDQALPKSMYLLYQILTKNIEFLEIANLNVPTYNNNQQSDCFNRDINTIRNLFILFKHSLMIDLFEDSSKFKKDIIQILKGQHNYKSILSINPLSLAIIQLLEEIEKYFPSFLRCLFIFEHFILSSAPDTTNVSKEQMIETQFLKQYFSINNQMESIDLLKSINENPFLNDWINQHSRLNSPTPTHLIDKSPPSFIELPKTFQDLLIKFSNEKCIQHKNIPENPYLCINCGTLVCKGIKCGGDQFDESFHHTFPGQQELDNLNWIIVTWIHIWNQTQLYPVENYYG
eukprot:gene1358-1714_t